MRSRTNVICARDGPQSLHMDNFFHLFPFCIIRLVDNINTQNETRPGCSAFCLFPALRVFVYKTKIENHLGLLNVCILFAFYSNSGGFFVTLDAGLVSQHIKCISSIGIS